MTHLPFTAIKIRPAGKPDNRTRTRDRIGKSPEGRRFDTRERRVDDNAVMATIRVLRRARASAACVILVVAGAGAAGLFARSVAAQSGQRRTATDADAMTTIAREDVRLVLALGQHDKDYVDAYYGPGDIKREAEAAKLTLDAIGAGVTGLSAQVQRLPAGSDELERLRHQYLEKQLSAMAARVRMLKGARLSFDEESKALYDAVAPTNTEAQFQEILAALDQRFPGSGPLVSRY